MMLAHLVLLYLKLGTSRPLSWVLFSTIIGLEAPKKQLSKMHLSDDELSF